MVLLGVRVTVLVQVWIVTVAESVTLLLAVSVTTTVSVASVLPAVYRPFESMTLPVPAEEDTAQV